MSLRPLIAIAAVLGASLLASGCLVSRSSENVPLSAPELEGLQPGVTSAAEVVAKLGAPVDVVQLGRRSAYLYRFTRTKRAGLFLLVVVLENVDVRSDRAWLFFDEDEVLTHVGTTLEGEAGEYAMPWQDSYD